MDELMARVPADLRDRFRAIVALTDRYCAKHLNDEFRTLCRACAADACAAGVPVGSGKPESWAAGVLSAVGYANFLGSDPSLAFHTPPADMAKRAGVSVATMHNKSKAVRDALGIDRFDPRYSTARLTEQNPLSGALALFEHLSAPPPAPVRSKKKRSAPAGPARLYTLAVTLLSGPITKAFIKKNKSVVRTIEIRGDQTLDDLHEAIFGAFDREDHHLYEFQFGAGPMDPKGPRYVMPAVGDDGAGPPVAGYTDDTTIDDLAPTVGKKFGYWFDFGDDWYHQVDVDAIADEAPAGTFPRVTARVGASPPQYADE